jgi:hypothetical protein
LKEENEELFEKLVDLVLKDHKLEDGITLCKNCHAEVDSFYRI